MANGGNTPNIAEVVRQQCELEGRLATLAEENAELLNRIQHLEKQKREMHNLYFGLEGRIKTLEQRGKLVNHDGFTANVMPSTNISMALLDSSFGSDMDFSAATD